jgi:hypothetical protein
LAELLHTNAVERGLVDLIVPPTPLQAPVFDFIAAAGGGSLAFKYRLSNCEMLVANVVHVLVRDKDGRLQQVTLTYPRVSSRILRMLTYAGVYCRRMLRGHWHAS